MAVFKFGVTKYVPSDLYKSIHMVMFVIGTKRYMYYCRTFSVLALWNLRWQQLRKEQLR